MDNTIDKTITKVHSKVIGKEHKEKIENYLYFARERKTHRIKKIHIYYNERNIYCFFPLFDTTNDEIYQDKVVSLLNGPGLSYVTARDLNYELGIEDKEISFGSNEVLWSIRAHFNILGRCDFIIIKTNIREFKFGNFSILEKGRELDELFFQDKFISSFQTSYQIVNNKPILASISAVFEKEVNKMKYLKKTKTFFFLEINKKQENRFFFHFNYLFSLFITIFILFFYYFYLTQNIFSGEIFIPKSEKYQISNESNIFTDYTGVVHIYADNLLDSIFNLGFIHARDRLWQIELTRRLAKGKLSEIYGNSALILDENIKDLKIDSRVKDILEQAKKNSKLLETLTIYSQGINLFIETQFLPFEFYYYNLKFEPWKLEDSIYCLIVFQLFHTFDIREEAQFHSISEIFNQFIKDVQFLKGVFKLNDSISDDIYTKIFRHKKENYNDLYILNKSNFSLLLHSQSNLIRSFPSTNYFVKMVLKTDLIFGITIPGIPAIFNGNNNFAIWSFNMKKMNSTQLIYFKNSKEQFNPTAFERFNSFKISGKESLEINRTINYINSTLNDDKKIFIDIKALNSIIVLESLISILDSKKFHEISNISIRMINADFDFRFIIKDKNIYTNSYHNISSQNLNENKFYEALKIVNINEDTSIRNKRFTDLINNQLYTSNNVSINSLEKILNDDIDIYALRFKKAFLNIIHNNRKFPEKVKYYKDLEDWDGKMSKNCYLPTIYSTLSLYSAYYFFKNEDKNVNNLLKYEISWILLLDVLEKLSKSKMNLKACNINKVNDKFNIHYINKFDCERFFIKIFEKLDVFLNDFKYSKNSIMKWGEVNKSTQTFPLSLIYNTISYTGSVNTIKFAYSGYSDLSFSTNFYSDNIILYDSRNFDIIKLYFSGCVSWNKFSKFNKKNEKKTLFMNVGKNKIDLLQRENILKIKPIES